MDKTILRNFAVESRKDLMEKIDRKIKLFYIDEEFKKDNRGDVIVLSNDKHSLTLTKEEDSNRDKLLRRIVELGYEQVVEEAAYTWFNRIIAIRYMEIHDILPLTRENQSLGIRVLSSKDNNADPEILKFSNLTMPDLDINFNQDFYSGLSKEDEKFKYVLCLICNKLSNVISPVFGDNTDYANLLIPDNMLQENGFVNKLIKTIDQSNFNKVEIIGWLYQYYNQEMKDYTMSNNKKAYKTHEIPYVTELFTPDWIVKYMVENTLCNYMNNVDISKYKYYIKDEKNRCNISPEEITFIDPCCGSGHILVYAFDVLYNIYEDNGYSKNDIPALILKNNIYGLDVDDRAGQLSILSVLLKAREYDKNIFNNNIISNLNIMSIPESNDLDYQNLQYLDNQKVAEEILQLLNTFKEGKNIGSLLKIKQINIEESIKYFSNNRDNNIFKMLLNNKIELLIKCYKILAKKYKVMVTNPPYMSVLNMNNKLKDYITKYYKDSKRDLCTAFMETSFVENNGLLGMINMHSWMFLGSYDKLREKILSNYSLINMIHLGAHAFEDIGGEVVQTTSFILKNVSPTEDSRATIIDLTNYSNALLKEKEFSNKNNYHVIDQKKYLNIPGNILAYSMSDKLIDIMINAPKLEQFGDAKQGLATTDNNKFLRLWYELNFDKINFTTKSVDETVENGSKWFPYNKAGFYRKWSSINEYVVNYENNGFEIKNSVMTKYPYLNNPGFVVKNTDSYFKSGITWNDVATGGFCARYVPSGFIYDAAGPMYFTNDYELFISYFNSNLFQIFADIICQGLHYSTGHIPEIPYLEIKDKDKIFLLKELVKENMSLSSYEWDSYETSWGFKKHPYLTLNKSLISDCHEEWNKITSDNFKKLKSNEEKINNIWITNANLNDEIQSEVKDNSVSYRKANKLLDIKSLISYAVGCMFGRYSLDEDGLIYSGGNFDKNKYHKFVPDEDNIIPVSDNANVYYKDDIVGKFTEFIKVTFGEQTLNANLNYIAEVLGKKGTESSEDTIRRYFVNDFFNDHVKTYQKRPIYWLFDSGKKNGFKCLIYLHRYDEQIVSKIRTKYLHNTLSIYQRTVEEIDYKLNNEGLSTTDKRELQNKKSDLNSKITECNEYEEIVGNVANKMVKIDLDDGVVINYEKFDGDNGKSILAKIK